MSDLQPKQAGRKRGRRQPFLLNQRFSEVVFWPCVLSMASSAALLIWTPTQLAAYHANLSVILAGTGLILILTFLFRLRAYAQCRVEGLRIQLPFYGCTIPYEEIKATRPSDFYRVFPPKEQPGLQRHFIEPLLARTVVVIELGALPRRKAWLRLWLSRYMFCPETVGLALPVRDWIAFRTELDDFRSKHRQYHY